MSDIIEQIARIQNKINRTNSKVYVYKVGPEKFSAMSSTNGMPLKSLVGIYLKNDMCYCDSIIDEDLSWAAKNMEPLS